jgi:hypothetical protein
MTGDSIDFPLPINDIRPMFAKRLINNAKIAVVIRETRCLKARNPTGQSEVNTVPSLRM